MSDNLNKDGYDSGLEGLVRVFANSNQRVTDPDDEILIRGICDCGSEDCDCNPAGTS